VAGTQGSNRIGGGEARKECVRGRGTKRAHAGRDWAEVSALSGRDSALHGSHMSCEGWRVYVCCMALLPSSRLSLSCFNSMSRVGKGAAKTHRTKKRIKHNTTTPNKTLKTLMIEPRIALCAQEYITSNRFEHQTSHHTTHHAMPHHVTCHTFNCLIALPRGKNSVLSFRPIRPEG